MEDARGNIKYYHGYVSLFPPFRPTEDGGWLVDHGRFAAVEMDWMRELQSEW